MYVAVATRAYSNDIPIPENGVRGCDAPSEARSGVKVNLTRRNYSQLGDCGKTNPRQVSPYKGSSGLVSVAFYDILKCHLTTLVQLSMRIYYHVIMQICCDIIM